jgi:small nuclear ribonucleoprotein (snRNP)-like protein
LKFKEIDLFKKFSIIALVVSLLSTSLFLGSVQAQGASSSNASKNHARVSKIGVGQNAKVEVKLKDQTKITGYISGIEANSFTVVDRVTGADHNLSYEDVTAVKRPGGGFSTKSWIILGSVAAGAIVTWIIVKPVLCDGGAQSRGPC